MYKGWYAIKPNQPTSSLVGLKNMLTVSFAEELDPLKRGCPGYNIKLHLMIRLQFWYLGNVEYPFIGITSKFTLTWAVVSVRVPFIDQTDILANYLY